MSISLPRVSLLIFLSAGSVLAAQPDLTKLPPPAKKSGLTYAKDIHPILEKSCFGCHGERRQRGELRLDSLEAALKGGEDGKVILPGKSQESPLVLAIAQVDDETAMPPKRRPGGGGRGGGGGGFGGFGMGRTQLSQEMIAQADKNGDDMASAKEWAALADVWVKKLDPQNTDKVNEEQFKERLSAAAAGDSQNDGDTQTQLASYVSSGFFTAADQNKDGAVSRTEFKNTMKKWSDEWGKESEGGLSQESLYAGLREVMPQDFGGPGGGGGGNAPTARGPQGRRGGSGDQAAASPQSRRGGPPSGNRGGPGGPGGPGGGNPPAPLTAEEVSLVRAWIDQGAN